MTLTVRSLRPIARLPSGVNKRQCWQIRFSIGAHCRSSSLSPDSIRREVCVTSRQSKREFFCFNYLLAAHIARRVADAYHTAYCISGLSAAQHRVCPSPTRRAEVHAAWKGEDGVRATAFAEALSWAEEDGGSHIVGSAANRVVCLIPTCFDRLVAKGVAERHTPSFQPNHHTYRGYHGTFL